jgi:transposase InsO family protein
MGDANGRHRRRQPPRRHNYATGQARRPAPDLVERNFSVRRTNQLWVADITYFPTATGFLYLAVVLDAFIRRIVGWAMQTYLNTALSAGSRGVRLPAKACCSPTVLTHWRRPSARLCSYRREFSGAQRRHRSWNARQLAVWGVVQSHVFSLMTWRTDLEPNLKDNFLGFER